MILRTYNQSTYFLLPAADIVLPKAHKEYLLNTYITTDSQHLVVSTRQGYLEIDATLRNIPSFVQSNQDKESIQYFYKIKEELKPTVVQPFLNGKYSEIDKEYIKDSFAENSAVQRIVSKDSAYRTHWESLIGQPLPHNAEVWPIADLKQELWDKLIRSQH